MNRQTLRVMGMAAVFLGGAGAAFAAVDPFGTPEQMLACEKELPTIGNWNPKRAKDYQISPACQAELDRRVKVCLADPEIQKITNDPQYRAHEDPPGYCIETVAGRMSDQLDAYKKEQAKAKAAEAEKAKIAAVEMPKADLHDAKLEKAIYSAYHLAYPENKIVKVVLTDRKWEMERSVTGRITGRDINASIVNKHPDGSCEIFSELWVQQHNGKTFAGPFEERGAGSLEKTEILCTKVK